MIQILRRFLDKSQNACVDGAVVLAREEWHLLASTILHKAIKDAIKLDKCDQDAIGTKQLKKYCSASQGKALKRNAIMENIDMLLCNMISACVEEVDDQPFESRIGEVSCFALKKRSVLFTVVH